MAPVAYLRPRRLVDFAVTKFTARAAVALFCAVLRQWRFFAPY
jgi:hypothetical protein